MAEQVTIQALRQRLREAEAEVLRAREHAIEAEQRALRAERSAREAWALVKALGYRAGSGAPTN